MTLSINNIKVKVKEKFLYNLDSSKNKLIDGELIGITTYLDQSITFHILIDGSFIYSNMPIHSFIWKETDLDLDLRDLIYSNCKTLDINMFTLSLDSVSVLSNKNWFRGKYLFSIDFHTGNDLLHFIMLDNGYFALLPNHKINFNSKEYLPDYKKMKSDWIV